MYAAWLGPFGALCWALATDTVGAVLLGSGRAGTAGALLLLGAPAQPPSLRDWNEVGSFAYLKTAPAALGSSPLTMRMTSVSLLGLHVVLLLGVSTRSMLVLGYWRQPACIPLFTGEA